MALWTPAELGSAVKGWWDAAEAGTITLSGSQITAWASRVGSISANQNTGVVTYSATARNGLPGAVMPGNANLVLSALTGFPTGSNEGRIIVVGYNAAGTYSAAFAYGNGVNGGDRIIQKAGATLGGRYASGDATIDIRGTGLGDGVSWNLDDVIFIGRAGPGNILGAKANGTTEATAVETVNTGSTFGYIGNVSFTFNGVIQEILVIDGSMTSGDIMRLEGYLAHKWSLSAKLPVDHPYKSAAPTINFWTPEELGSVVKGWWDAQETSTITESGGAVSSWASRVNGITANQATEAAKPTYSATARNSLPGVTGDGGDFLALSAFTDFPIGSNEVRLVLVGHTTGNNYQNAIGYGAGATQSHKIIVGGSPFAGNVVGSSAFFNINSGVLWQGNDRISIADFSGGFGGIKVDGGSRFSGSGASTTITGTVGGLFGVDVASFPGTIQEALIIAGAMSSDDIARLEGYLAHKWGLTANLPVDHPYKYLEPEVILVSSPGRRFRFNIRRWLAITSLSFTQPDEIADLFGWWDPSDLSTLTIDGSNRVSAMTDKSGNGRTVTQASVTRQPFAYANINGRLALSHDGADEFLYRDETLTYFSGEDQPSTWFAVCDPDVVGELGEVFTFNAVAGNSYQALRVTGTGAYGVAKRDTTEAALTRTGGAVDASPVIITAIFHGTTVTIRVNGVVVASNQSLDAGTMNVSCMVIGAWYQNNSLFNAFDGKTGEIAIYARELTEAEIGEVESYLSDRWSITLETAEVDPLWGDVVLLIGADGKGVQGDLPTNLDESSFAKTNSWFDTALENLAYGLNEVNPLVGTADLNIRRAVAGGQHLSPQWTAGDTDFQPATNNTWEMVFHRSDAYDNLTIQHDLFSIWLSGTNGRGFILSVGSNGVKIFYATTSSNSLSGQLTTYTFNSNIKYYIAFVKIGLEIEVFVADLTNSVFVGSIGTITLSAEPYFPTTIEFRVGMHESSSGQGSNGFGGQIDEARVTRAARTITGIPTLPFPRSGSPGIKLVGFSVAMTNGTTSGTTNFALTGMGGVGAIGGDAEEGDLVIAFYTVAQSAVNNNLSLQIQDPGGAEYTRLEDLIAYDGINPTCNLEIAYKRMGATPDVNTVFGPTTNLDFGGVRGVIVLRGVDNAIEDVVTQIATGFGYFAPQPASITPVTPGSKILIIGATAHIAGPFDYTFPGGELASSSFVANDVWDATGGFALYEWTSGEFNPTDWTPGAGADRSYACVTIALRPSLS